MQNDPPLEVLSLYPFTRGYAFVHFKGRGQVVDWGCRIVRAAPDRRNATLMASIQALVDAAPPDVVVIDDHTEPGARRSARVRRLHRSIVHMAKSRGIDLGTVRRDEVRAAFSNVGAVSRHEIAQAVAREFQEFGHRLPRKRPVWGTEPEALKVFMAAALAVTYYARTPAA